MVVASRLSSDLELLSSFPDGTVTIDLLNGTTAHSSGRVLSLNVANDLCSWLEERLVQNGGSLGALSRAELMVSIKTDRVPTNRERIVPFDLECTSILSAGKKIYEGRAKKLVWYKPPSYADLKR